MNQLSNTIADRQNKIDAGKIWQVYKAEDLDNILFEGSRSKCKTFIAVNCPHAYKSGAIRLGQLIYEKQNNQQ